MKLARFARNVECDFFCNFQTLCLMYEVVVLVCTLRKLEIFSLLRRMSFLKNDGDGKNASVECCSLSLIDLRDRCGLKIAEHIFWGC